MKKRLHGPSRYYASDKNVFDALNQHKVDTPTVMQLFECRNIIVGKATSRENLAKYFSRLTHDYYDHQNIASRLGITPRRERITSIDVKGIDGKEEIQIAVEQVKEELESAGDVVHVSGEGNNLSLEVQYSTIDYKLNEFSQVQIRDGTIEFIESPDGYIIRNTQNDYINNVRGTLLTKIDKEKDIPLTKVEVSLFDISSHKLRSRFFHDLMMNIDGYSLSDVTSVYVFKAKPEDDEPGDEPGDTDTHVERVF
jgi:hypothetical protein